MKLPYMWEITIGVYPIENTVAFCFLLGSQNNTAHTREYFFFLILAKGSLEERTRF